MTPSQKITKEMFQVFMDYPKSAIRLLCANEAIFLSCFVTSRLQWNLFVKPEEQGYVYIVIALARKGRIQFNPIAPLSLTLLNIAVL